MIVSLQLVESIEGRDASLAVECETEESELAEIWDRAVAGCGKRILALLKTYSIDKNSFEAEITKKESSQQ